MSFIVIHKDASPKHADETVSVNIFSWINSFEVFDPYRLSILIAYNLYAAGLY